MARSFREAEEASNAAYYLQQAGVDARTIASLQYADQADIQAALAASQQLKDANAALEADKAAKAEAAKAAAEAAAEKARLAALGKINTQSPTSAANDALLQQIIAQNNTAAAEAAKLKLTTRQSAVDVVTARFKQYGLETLASRIKELAVDGATESTITLALQDTDEYKTRFKANQARLKAGLQVLQPAEYLNVEDGYRQVLRSYGMNQFATDEYVQKFIENDVSAKELSDRVTIAVQQVQNADPAILRQLKDYYGIAAGDAAAYILDPNQQITKIQRQVAAAQIGVAAAKQGLQSNAAVSEQLAAQGITEAQAQKGYATIADILPNAEKLSQIYGDIGTYDQSTAEQEMFNQLASAQRKRQQLTARELASFSGSSGLARGGLSEGKAAGQI